MKKFLCFALLLTLLLSACGRTSAQPTEPAGTAAPTTAPESTPKPTPAPTPTPEPTPEPEPDDPLERALRFLRAQDGDYVSRHMNTYLELYRMMHPGANVLAISWTHDARHMQLNMMGLDVQAFLDAGYFPDLVTVSSMGYANEFVPLAEPIPREPEWERVSEQGVRVTMDRADWPVGAEYVRFTMRNEGEESYLYGADVELQKYVEGSWKALRHSGVILAIGYYLNPGNERSLTPPMVYFPALGEGLYRVGFIRDGVWAEFAVRADAEPVDVSDIGRVSWPEAALLLAGLPETVESDLRDTRWPAMSSSSWELREERRFTDEELAALLLGEEAEYDAAAEVYRLGNGTLDLKQGAELDRDDLPAKALRLVLENTPASPEKAGWKSRQRTAMLPPLDSLYPEIIGTSYAPDPDVLNQRLEAALETLGEDAGELRNFRFTSEDLRDLRLLLVPVSTEGSYPKGFPLCSPEGELASSAAWCVYRNTYDTDAGTVSMEFLVLHARYTGYTLVPGEQHQTRSPLEQAEKFIPLLREEGIRLVSFDYVLIPDLHEREGKTLHPAYRLLAETASGEERCFVVSAVSRGASAYDLQRRAYLEELMNAHTVTDIFETCWAQYPEMDVWPVSFGIRALEDGREALMIDCDGVDCPALEASGLLPEGVALNYPEEQFNQKEAHPCPWEPEWEKSWAGGTVTLTMAQAEYPLYPDYVELTVRCERSFNRNWDRFEKYADGEWHHVREWMAGTLGLRYVESGETVLQVRTNAKLGPGLYRLYINDEYWVEFKVSEMEE